MCWKNNEPLAKFEPICIISDDQLGFINIHNGYVQSDTPLQRKVTHLYKEMKGGHTMTALLLWLIRKMLLHVRC